MNTKTCKTCLVEKPIKEFLLCGTWRKGSCKTCCSIKHKKWANNNKEYLKSYQKNLYHTNSSYKESCKKCSSLYKQNPLNKAKIRKASRLYGKKWRQNPKNRILSNLRRRFAHVLNGNRKVDVTLKLIGCNRKHFMNYIEKQFRPGMTWKNYGLYGWHIDHIKPCSSFDLTKAEEQQKCFHYTNLQPLWAKDNLKKRDSYLTLESTKLT